jgi:parallel beta-helix repeat protein
MNLNRKIPGYGGLVLLFVLAIQTISSAQTTYYVSSTGNDTNTGRSAGAPFQTIAKLNSLSLSGGDSILFRRGDTFRGGLVIRDAGLPGKPIVFDAYSSGPNPVLSGSVPLSGWTPLGSNIWEAPCPDCGSRVTGVYRNGTSLPLGRYPNPDAPGRGYLTIQSHVTTTQLESQQPLSTNWTGGEVVVRPTYWIIDRATITNQTGNTLTLANSSTYGLTDGWGYFIQNHPATLDQPGEWYYDPNRKTIRLYATRSDLTNQLITATTTARGIDLANTSNVTIRNLHVRETQAELLYADNVSNLTLQHNRFADSGEDGLILTGSGSNVLIENSQIVNINNNGIVSGDYKNLTIRGSLIRHIGLQPGRGKNGDGQFTGLRYLGTTSLIENNIIDSVGYVGINFWTNTTIRNNVIANFCMTKSDGGGLYVWNGNKQSMSNIKIVSNIIRDGIGTPGGTADETFSGAHGVFLDDCAEGVELADNTVINCHGLGIYLHAVNNVNLFRNTCFNNSVGQLILYNDGNLCPTYGNRINGNVFMSPLRNQGVVGYLAGGNDLATYGSMENNYYARPFDDVFTIRAVHNKTIGDDLALVQWQSIYGHDLTSRTSPITYNDYRVKSGSARSRLASNFDRNRDEWTTWSSGGKGQAQWDNSNRLDTGSLRIDCLPMDAGRDSYVLVYKGIPDVSRAKSYVVTFDVVASGNKKVAVFLRQREGPYQDLTRRVQFLAGSTRQHHEFAFTALADEIDGLLTFQTAEDGETVWLDNIQLQEATTEPVNPSDMIKLMYNPTMHDSLITLTTTYRDVKNHYHGKQVRLKPFTSAALLYDPHPPVDIRLSLRASQPSPSLGEAVSLSVTIHNESDNRGLTSNQVQWTCLLPDSLALVSSTGLQQTGRLLSGTVQNLRTDTTFVFRVRASLPGTYPIMAQVSRATYADPDSTPDADSTQTGDDDYATVRLVFGGPRDVVTDVEPEPASPRCQVFPNPGQDAFTLVIDQTAVMCELIDMTGRLQRMPTLPRKGELMSFGHELAPGQYILRIRYEGGANETVKLLKTGR